MSLLNTQLQIKLSKGKLAVHCTFYNTMYSEFSFGTRLNHYQYVISTVNNVQYVLYTVHCSINIH